MTTLLVCLLYTPAFICMCIYTLPPPRLCILYILPQIIYPLSTPPPPTHTQISRYEKLTDTLRSQVDDLQGIQGHLEEQLVQYRTEIARHVRQCDEGGTHILSTHTLSTHTRTAPINTHPIILYQHTSSTYLLNTPNLLIKHPYEPTFSYTLSTHSLIPLLTLSHPTPLPSPLITL